MKYAMIFCFLISIVHVNGQSFALQNAINAYTIKNISVANQQIERAIRHPQTSSWVKTWNYYFLINERNYESAKSISDSIEFTYKMIDAFSKCKTLDTDVLYSLKLRSKIEKVSAHYKNNTELKYSNGNLEAFVRYGKVSAHIFEILDATPSEKFYFLLAQASNEVGDLEGSAKCYQKSIDLGHHNEQSYVGLVDVLIRLGKNDEADAKFNEAKELFRDNDVFLVAEIKRLMKDELYFKARTYLHESIESNLTNPILYYYLGQVNDKMNLQEDAFNAYLKASELNVYHYEANVEVGRYFLNAGTADANDSVLNLAKAHLERADSLNSTNKEVLKMLEDLYLELRDLEKFQQIRNRNN